MKIQKIFDKAKNTPYNELRNKNVDEKSKFFGAAQRDYGW